MKPIRRGQAKAQLQLVCPLTLKNTYIIELTLNTETPIPPVTSICSCSPAVSTLVKYKNFSGSICLQQLQSHVFHALYDVVAMWMCTALFPDRTGRCDSKRGLVCSFPVMLSPTVTIRIGSDW